MLGRLSVTGVVLLGACQTTAGGPGPGGGGPQAVVQITADLADGSTSVGQGPFGVAFYGAGRVLDDGTMAHLMSRLVIRTWPEGDAIAASPSPDPTSSTTMARVQLAPSSPLGDRWYALDFGPAEGGLQTNQTLEDGTWGVRLRPGSHPAVRLIELCGADVPGLKLVASFSETMALDGSSQPFTVTRGGGAVSCPPYDTTAETLYAFCADLKPGEVTISLDPSGVLSQSGAPLSAGSWTFDSSTLPATSSGCQGFRVPIE